MGVFSVKQLNDYIKGKLNEDRMLANLWVRGELFNVKLHSSGHLYFTLKESETGIKCVMFRSRSTFLKFEPQNGMQVLVGGYVGVYERDSTCQIYVQHIQPDGLGSLSLALEQLKQKLNAEGLFANERKRSLPMFPQTIGIITSLTGAAIHDMIKVAKRRYPAIQLLAFPVLVQGSEAPEQIVRAISLLNGPLPGGVPQPNVLIVGRGGGSLEELWAFNDERVVRAIAASRIPVVSAVGHETDVTLCDFVADKRAPTPSAAAELVVPHVAELLRYEENLNQRLHHSMAVAFNKARDKLNALMERRVMRRSEEWVNQRRQYTDQLGQRLLTAMKTQQQRSVMALASISRQLQVLSPLHCLSRGYSITTDWQGHMIKSIADVQQGKRVLVRLQDGDLECEVTAKRSKQHGGEPE